MQARDIVRANRKFTRILYTTRRADREIDRAFRRVVSAAHRESRANNPAPRSTVVSAFKASDGRVLAYDRLPPMCEQDAVKSRVVVDRFKNAVAIQHKHLLEHVSRMHVPGAEDVEFQGQTVVGN
jgi:hypothetical protein